MPNKINSELHITFEQDVASGRVMFKFRTSPSGDFLYKITDSVFNNNSEVETYFNEHKESSYLEVVVVKNIN